MKKSSFTPLQTALVTFIVVFVLSPVVFAPILGWLEYINSDLHFGLLTALVCGGFTWVFATVRNHLAHVNALHEQIDLLTDQINLLTEHINILEGTQPPADKPSSDPEKD